MKMNRIVLGGTVYEIIPSKTGEQCCMKCDLNEQCLFSNERNRIRKICFHICPNLSRFKEMRKCH